MALDSAISDLLNTMIITGSKDGGQLTAAMDRNLTQGLGVVNIAIIQAQGSVSDDAGLIAALQTAATAPVQGAVGK